MVVLFKVIPSGTLVPSLPGNSVFGSEYHGKDILKRGRGRFDKFQPLGPIESPTVFILFGKLQRQSAFRRLLILLSLDFGGNPSLLCLPRLRGSLGFPVFLLGPPAKARLVEVFGRLPWSDSPGLFWGRGFVEGGWECEACVNGFFLGRQGV